MYLVILQIIIGIALLYKGAEWLVGSSARVAQHLGISRVIIGLTIIAVGTSLPELIGSLMATLEGAPEIALGNVLGSNIANVALVLGLASLIKPIRTHVDDLYRDAPWLLFGSVLFLILAIDGIISRFDGAVLVAFGILFFWSIVTHVRNHKHIDEEELPFQEFEVKARDRIKNYLLIILGLVALGGGAQLLVTGSVTVAQALGVSELLIGITLVAVGTSLPELAASAWSAAHGKVEVTLGNVIGSNIANIFVILGIVSLVRPIGVPSPSLSFDIPFMILITFLALSLIRSREQLSRVEGAFLVVIYITYIVWSFS